MTSSFVFNLSQILKYPIAIAKTKKGFSVSSPDMPNLGSKGETVEKARQEFAKELELHFAKLAADNMPIPQSTYQSGDFVENKFIDSLNWYCGFSDRYCEKMRLNDKKKY